MRYSNIVSILVLIFGIYNTQAESANSDVPQISSEISLQNEKDKCNSLLKEILEPFEYVSTYRHTNIYIHDIIMKYFENRLNITSPKDNSEFKVFKSKLHSWFDLLQIKINNLLKSLIACPTLLELKQDEINGLWYAIYPVGLRSDLNDLLLSLSSRIREFNSDKSLQNHQG